MPNGKKCPQCGIALPANALDGLCPACLLKQGAAAETATQPDATTFQPPSVADVARLFPQLEILAFIGKGGMGAVYKARQASLDRLVALKLLPSQAVSSPGFVERFNREARALAKLSHPNIVTVHEFGQVNGLPFFIMEFVDGLNLRQLERAGDLSPREALQIVPQICEALQFAHNEGIVHRDIKPENILLDKKGRVKIADFGIAKIMGREPDVAITETEGALGTPSYMAPEQVEKPQAVDHRADIYSLGVVFYEMLTGELPLGKFAPPSRKVMVDVRLDEVVLHALEKEPERRYQQASQVKSDVETIATGMGSAQAKPPETTAPTDATIIPPVNEPSQPPWRFYWGTWEPFQSPEVREIRAHLTKEERNQVALLGLLFGVWNATTIFGIPALIRSCPSPGNWIVASVWGTLFLVSIPVWQRLVRQYLCSTPWAAKHGFTPQRLRLISFRGNNLGLCLLLLLLALVVAQHKAITHYLGFSELTEPHLVREALPKKSALQAEANFSPVIERTLNVSGDQFGFIDLDTGKTYLHQAGSAAEVNTMSKPNAFSDWIATNGIDLGFVTNVSGDVELAGFDLGYFSFPNEPVRAELSVAQGIYHGVTNFGEDVRADHLWKELSGILTNHHD